MRKIVITGASGNVGSEVIKKLALEEGDFQILAGLRKKGESIKKGPNHNIGAVHFDFADQNSIREALSDCHTLFLLRPPQISEVKKFFVPIVNIAKEKNVKHVVFLSVQGVESSSIIPHHKIEKLIVDSGINYTFLRPAYFMQNFTTTLREELLNNNRIYLPAGEAKFTLIDVEDIGSVAAEVLKSPDNHINKSYDLTNEELLNFQEMAKILSQILGREITYKSPNLISFFITKKKEGVSAMYILVMIMLHYFPRFKSSPNTSKWVEALTGSKPTTFNDFVKKNKALLSQ